MESGVEVLKGLIVGMSNIAITKVVKTTRLFIFIDIKFYIA